MNVIKQDWTVNNITEEQKKTDNTNKDIIKRMKDIEMALSCVLTNQMSLMTLKLENEKLKEEQRKMLHEGVLATSCVVQDIMKSCVPEEMLEDKFLKALGEILK